MAALNLKEGDTAIDCTVGGGGHTAALLNAVGARGRVVGFDRDAAALQVARERLAQPLSGGQLTLVQGCFSSLLSQSRALDLTGKAAAIIADIGVSSMHLDQADRGFSFQKDGPLDMRMDQKGRGRTAADLVAEATEDELTQIFQDFGEEPKARKIARALVRERTINPITTTTQLATFVANAAAWGAPSRTHPATRVFQALRIAVNNELEELEQFLEQALTVVESKGRIGVITFHSLEDRIVKKTMQRWAGISRDSQTLPRDLPLTAPELARHQSARAEILKPFPGKPGPEEVAANVRSRSAKLRVVRKV